MTLSVTNPSTGIVFFSTDRIQDAAVKEAFQSEFRVIRGLAGSYTISGIASIAQGGTGIASYTIGDLLYASGATTLSKLEDVATGNAIISGGIGVAPTWGKIGLTTHISGNLPVGNLGSGTGAGATTFWRGDGSWAVPAGTGVTSVAETVSVATAPTVNLSVSGSPITGAGTLALSISPWWMQKGSVDTGETLTIASGYQAIFAGELVNSGTINNSGTRMVI